MATATLEKLNTKSVEDKVLAFGRKLISAGIPISKLILFGSFAKNTPREHSDIDVLVVSPNFGKDHIGEMQYLSREVGDIDVRIEAIPASPAKYDKLASPLMSEIHKTGRELTDLL